MTRSAEAGAAPRAAGVPSAARASSGTRAPGGGPRGPVAGGGRRPGGGPGAKKVRAGRKPGSVPPLRRVTVIDLGPPSPAGSNGLPGSPAARAAPWGPLAGPRPPLCGLSPGGVCRAEGVAVLAVGSYPTVSPLPDPREGPSAVCSLLHCPWACARRALPATEPCGARTFLEDRSSRRSCPHGPRHPRTPRPSRNAGPARTGPRVPEGAPPAHVAPSRARGPRVPYQFVSFLWSFHQSRNCFGFVSWDWPVSACSALRSAAP